MLDLHLNVALVPSRARAVSPAGRGRLLVTDMDTGALIVQAAPSDYRLAVAVETHPRVPDAQLPAACRSLTRSP